MDPKLKKALIRGWIIGSSFYLIMLTITGGLFRPFYFGGDHGAAVNTVLNLLFVLSPVGGLAGALGLYALLFMINFVVSRITPMQLHSFVFGRAEESEPEAPAGPEEQLERMIALPVGSFKFTAAAPERLRGLSCRVAGDKKVHADLPESGWTQVGVFKKQPDGFSRLLMKGGAADGGTAEVGYYFDRAVYHGKPPLRDSLTPGEKQKATLKAQIKIAQFG